MSRYTGAGRAILAAVKEDISRAGTEMDLNAGYDHLPREHRARIRDESVKDIQAAREAARRSIEEWAAEQRASATKRLAPSLGTSAEEARRMSEELRITRLVESNRETRGAPDDLADRAAAAYARGDSSEARVLAQAARELRPMQAHLANEILGNLEADEILADPQRAKALRDLNDVDVVISVFERDVAATTSKALQQSAKLALALGDGVAAAKSMRDASADGRAAKFAAYLEAQRLGVPYQEPEGVVHGLATGTPSQPEGAHLPEPMR